MLTGAVEVYANHSVLLVGSSGWPELVWGGGPVDADSQHVAIQTRGQNASRVHVGLGISKDAAVQALPSPGRSALFEVLTSERDGLALPSARGLVLDGHDSPRARLAAAIMLLSAPDPAKPWLEGYETRIIAEWLRWLGINTSHSNAEEASQEILRRVQDARAGAACVRGMPHHIADQIADAALTILDLGST